MNAADGQYLALLKLLLEHGVHREGRNGGTRGLFGAQMRFDLAEGFPLLTTKKLHTKSIIVELLWFLRGYTNVGWLREHGVTIWDEWADESGELGPVYGSQWRRWAYPVTHPKWGRQHLDQIAELLRELRTNPYSRRHLVTAWNPVELESMALPPCHCLWQMHVAEGKLSCHLYQRSADWFLGVPFNIASYALLTHLVAREVDLDVGDFIHSFGDLHLYDNHVEQAREQLTREPRSLPRLQINPDPNLGIFDLMPTDVALLGYDPHPAIKAEVSV